MRKEIERKNSIGLEGDRRIWMTLLGILENTIYH